MKKFPLSLTLLVLLSCSQEVKKPKEKLTADFLKGELQTVIKERNLSEKDLLAATKTYNPSGSTSEYFAFYGLGVSGRLAVVAVPSMKILKYVSVFSAEPWQGYSFDDQSSAITKGSARDELEYSYGDSGKPALSLTNGKHDGRALFMSDGANGRIALIDLAEYETKQIETHPLFKNASFDLSITSDSKYVLQTNRISDEENRLGLTFWHFVEKEGKDHKALMLDPKTSFTFLTSGENQSAPVMGKGVSDGFAYTVSKGESTKLNIFNLKLGEEIINRKPEIINGHLTLSLKTLREKNILKEIDLGVGAYKVNLSGNGEYGVITNIEDKNIYLFNTKKPEEMKKINIEGLSLNSVFTKDFVYVLSYKQEKIVKISLATNKIIKEYPLDFIPSDISLVNEDSIDNEHPYLFVTNLSPNGKVTAVGPQGALMTRVFEQKDNDLFEIYNASIPQATRLSPILMSTKVNKPVYKYAIGTDPRTSTLSSFLTYAGQEKIIRDGKRVHVFATLIRSHITPDFVEVEEGDIVSFHLTSSEQSKDNTHGFTIDTYNVHGSYEPGKTASVTFVADRPGVFPFYCTEFCSALHLEMQGYLLVKPVKNKRHIRKDKLVKMKNNKVMNQFFDYIKGNKDED